MSLINLRLVKNSHRRCSIRRGVLRNFAKFTGKHLCQSLFFNKFAVLAKMHAYGFDLNSLTFLYWYLKNRMQNVKINNTCSIFQILLSGVPQGSILGPILFNIFINNLLMSTQISELHNFVDDNTIPCPSSTSSQLIKDWQREANKVTDWFKMNNMTVNPEKIQAIIIDWKWQNNNPTEINIDGKKSILKVVYTIWVRNW